MTLMRCNIEKIIPRHGHSFQTLDAIGPVIKCNFHVHPEYELTYVASSHGTRIVGDHVGAFSKGDLVLIGSMMPHHYYSDPKHSKSSRWGHARVIQFKKDFAGEQFFALPEMYSINRMIEEASFGLEFPRKEVVQAPVLIDQLFKAEGPKKLSLFLELMLVLANSRYRRLSAHPGPAAHIPPSHRMNAVINYVQAAVAAGRTPSLASAAQKASMNPQAFSRYFHRTTFKRFIEYINDLRIGRACHLLLNSDKTIAEICFEAGFGNLSNFNRAFLRVKGMSPKKFRETFMFHCEES